MKIWITGICGFLGSTLAVELTKLGHKVYGNDNLICDAVNFLHLYESPYNFGNLENGSVHLKDCREFSVMKDALTEGYAKGIEILIHCAATAHEGLSNFSPSLITQNIYEASVATFSAAIASGVKRIIFMSSMARYGHGSQNESPPFIESFRCSPVDPYGIAKVAAEDTLKALCKLHNVEYVIAVPHNIIGPRQNYTDPYRNVASIMINRALQGKPIIVYGDGLQKRCFSPIKDCLNSLVKMIDASISGETINIGPDKGEITILELAQKIIAFTGSTAGIMHVADRPNEVKVAYCSSDKARRLLGFNPQQNIDECLKEMVDHIREETRILGVREFKYRFPLEIEKGAPDTWKNRLI